MSKHDCEPDANFSGGDGEHEQREHLSDDGVVERTEGDEVHVDRGEHQLDAHEHEHCVLAREHAVDPGAEQEGAEEQELVEQHRRVSPSAPGRLRR